jgi:hypothetical protein
VPPDGAPTERNAMIPATMASAPSQTRPLMRWLVRRAPSGRASTRLMAVSDCTTMSEPWSSAAACSTQPLDWHAAPASQTGRCRIWVRKCGRPRPRRSRGFHAAAGRSRARTPSRPAARGRTPSSQRAAGGRVPAKPAQTRSSRDRRRHGISGPDRTRVPHAIRASSCRSRSPAARSVRVVRRGDAR